MSRLKMLSNLVTSKAGLQVLQMRKHSPVVLFTVGVVGVVGAAVLASRATLKLNRVLEVHEETLDDIAMDHAAANIDDEKNRKELMKAKLDVTVQVVKLYAPAVVVGSLSIAALTGSHYILTQRNGALMAAYAALDKGYKAYRKRVVNELGEDKDREFQNGSREREIVEETAEGPVVKTIREVDPNGYSVYAKFFDQNNSNWSPEWEYNRIFLQCQQNYANQKLQARGYVLLNEVYESLGMPHTRAGCVVGWLLTKGGDNFVDFGIFDRNKEMARHFVNGNEGAILLDFNVDGVVFDKIAEDCE